MIQSALSLGGCMPMARSAPWRRWNTITATAGTSRRGPTAPSASSVRRGDQADRGRQDVRDVEEDHAHRGDGRVDRRVGGEQHGERSAPVQIATRGVRNAALTRRSAFEPGRPPSRANANAIRDAEVTVASPHRYCATTMPTIERHAPATAAGPRPWSRRTRSRPAPPPGPCRGIASTTADSITQPNSARDQHRAHDAARHVCARRRPSPRRRVGRGVEAGDRVRRQQEAEQRTARRACRSAARRRRRRRRRCSW